MADLNQSLTEQLNESNRGFFAIDITNGTNQTERQQAAEEERKSVMEQSNDSSAGAMPILSLDKKYHSDVLYRPAKAPDASMRKSFISATESLAFKKNWVLYQIVKIEMDHTVAELLLEKIDYVNLEKENLLTLLLDRLVRHEENYQEERKEMLSNDLNITDILLRAKKRFGELSTSPTREKRNLGVVLTNTRQRSHSEGFTIGAGLNNSSVIGNENQAATQSIQQSETRLCEVCLDNKELTDMVRVSNVCQCVYCRDCLQNHISGQIMNGRVLDVCCPNELCRTPLTDADVEQICSTNKALFQRFQRIKMSARLAQDPLTKWCTRPGCETPLHAKNRSQEFITCPKCEQQVCVKCGADHHAGYSCEEVVNKLYTEALKQFKIHACPLCKSPIQKSTGCNHMTCWNCKHQFCWLCFRTYNPNHYKSWNVCCGCPGAQFTEGSPNRFKVVCKCVLMTILYFFIVIAYVLGAVLLFALYPLIFAPVMPKLFYEKCNCSFWHDWFGYGACSRFVYILLALILFPICLVLAIFPGYFFMYWVLKWIFD